MATQQGVDIVEEELSHIPPGEGPQEALRRAYREMRLSRLDEERKPVFHDALMSVFKTNPLFKFRYDGSYFQHT
jgi:hypothetical protein